MSLRHNAIFAIAASLALCAISACGDDEPDPSGAGSGAGTTSSGGHGGEAATHAGAGGVSGTHAGAGAGGTSAGASGAGGMSAGAAGSSGGMAGTGAGSGGSPQDAGIDSGSDAGPELEGCVVAERIDACCPSWAAVTRAEAFADPCLVAIGEPPVSGIEIQTCFPEFCTDVLCPDAAALSRVAEPLGGNGECVFVDECHAEATCVIGVDMTRCCPCPESLPKTLVDREPCVIYEAMSALPDGCTNPCPADCAECPDVTEPSCSIRDSASACQ